MSDTCRTVRVHSKNGPLDINEADYDPKVHKLLDGKKAAAEVEPKTETTPVVALTGTGNGGENTPVAAYTLGKNGKRGGASKFVILDVDGNVYGEEFNKEEDAKAMLELLVPSGAAA